MSKTVAVVLHYENDWLTSCCIESIKQTAPEVHILVVDNNSPSPYTFSNEGITVIRNYDRHAVSGMNAGFLWALNQMNADYVVNFDNDIICLENWHQPLIDAMESDQKIGIVGGKQWDKDKVNFRSIGADLIGGHLWANAPKQQEEVMWIQGSAVMMRAEMMRKIGVHDDRFKIICSDSDYCLHAKDRGWKVVFVPESNVIHFGGSSYASACETWKEDNENLLWKWSGKAATKMLAGFPIDSNKNQYLEIKYSVKNSPAN